MSRKCAVINCKKRYTGKSCEISFFAFPSDETLQKKWLKFCLQGKVENKINPKCSRICMLHFKRDDFGNSLQLEMGLAERCYLRRGAVPSINTTSKGNVELQKRREARINKRERKKIVEALLKEHSTAGKSIHSEKLVANEANLLGQTEASAVELFRDQVPNIKKRRRDNIADSVFKESSTVGAYFQLDNLGDNEIGLLEETEASILPDDSYEDEANLLEETEGSIPPEDLYENEDHILEAPILPDNFNENKVDLLREIEPPVFQSLYIVEEVENESNILDKKSSLIIESLKAKLEILQKENRALRKNAKKHVFEMKRVEVVMDEMEHEMEILQMKIEESNLQLANLEEKLRVND